MLPSGLAILSYSKAFNLLSKRLGSSQQQVDKDSSRGGTTSARVRRFLYRGVQDFCTLCADDWVDINDAGDDSDSGWSTPSCASPQPGSPRSPAAGAAPTPAGAKPASRAIAALASKAKDAATDTSDEAVAVAPDSPPQVWGDR